MDDEFTEDELALRLRWGRIAARNRLLEGARLTAALPHNLTGPLRGGRAPEHVVTRYVDQYVRGERRAACCS